MDGDFRAGVRDISPVLLGVVPFGLVFGIAAVEAGFTTAQTIGMTVLVYAGASQLAAIELFGESAPLAVIVFTAIVINLRMMMYSASIAPHFQDLRVRTRAGLAYFLTDQAYAMSISEFSRNSERARIPYYLGTALGIWAVWVASTVLGVVLGAGVPPEWGLSFAVPLVFLAILVPSMTDRATIVAGIVGGAVALVAAGVPFDLGLLIGAIAGLLAGLVVEGVENL